MKIHSWPYPVLSCQTLCEEHERDYLPQCDFRLTLKKKKTGIFEMTAYVGSKELVKELMSGVVSLVIFEEALASPLRRARKIDVANHNDGNFVSDLQIDSAKFSGGLKVCAYIVAAKDFSLSTKECVKGYGLTVKVSEGSLLGYSNAKLIEDRKAPFADLFAVRNDPNIKAMSVDYEGNIIRVSLPPNFFNSYKIYRGTEGKGRAASTVATAVLVPALIEVLAAMAYQVPEGEVWPEDMIGARGVLVRELTKMGIMPDDLRQKGAANAASMLTLRMPFNMTKLFEELENVFMDN